MKNRPSPLVLGTHLGALLLSVGALAADPPPFYDEIFDTQGKLRPQYEQIYPVYKKMTEKQKREFRSDTKFLDFKGDNALEPIPRVLTQSEYETLKKGVEQRGTALRMFLQDYYGGGASWKKVIPEHVLERIIARNGELGFKGRIRPDAIAFPYGPDILRTAEGTWAVIEDNPGYIGGIGDLQQATESLMKRKPEYKSVTPLLHDPMEYYVSVIARAKARARSHGEKVILYMVPPASDGEDARIKKIFKSLGVETVTPHTQRKLAVKPDGVYLTQIDGQPPEKVGFIFIGSEHQFVDAKDPAVLDKLLISEATASASELKDMPEGQAIRKALLPDPKTGKVEISRVKAAFEGWESEISENIRQSVPGLMNAIYEGKVATNYTPGLDFIGDKEFYTYVDDLVRHYLKVEPAVTNLKTVRFAVQKNGKIVIDKELMDRLFKEGQYKNYVIKVVDGRGGDGIFIGPRMTETEIPGLVKMIMDNPESFIAQEYKHLSVMADSIVDLRLISDVSPNSIYVTRTPWGRGVPLAGDGKVNLSAHGKEFMLGIVPDPGCVNQKIREFIHNLKPAH